MKALLLSGGIESTAIAYWLRPDIAITIDYGQLAAAGEIRASAAIANELGVEHIVVTSDSYLSAPPARASGSLWWPYRNQLLITLAAINLHDRPISELWIGLVNGDIYKDCKPEFMRAMTDLMLIQEQRVLVIAPAIALTTLELLTASNVPQDLLGASLSCHFGELPCGICAGCSKSRTVLREYARIKQQT